MPLSLSTEPYPRSGGMSGEGARRLLGVPALTPLQTVIREAGQNSWDARRGEHSSFDIHLRRPSPAQWNYIATEILAELPAAPTSRDAISTALASAEPLLLEIADFQTRGLGGPTRADLVEDGAPQNFANFVRNIGAGHHAHLGGGTYGYGKTSFYRLDPAATVIIDSLALVEGGTERRLIACHLGDEHVIDGKRFTGRFWWGEADPSDPDYVEPLTGPEAEAAARAIGLPERSGDTGTGTTISVLVPSFGDMEERVREITEALLWFFWPKMIDREDGRPPMALSLRSDGEPVIIPRPELFPPLELFVEAWHQLREGGHEVREIRCGKPRKLLGHLSIARGFRSERRQLASETVIPMTSRHVALMRPVELIVKYLEGPALPHGSHEWAGVFICSSEAEVERAFAAAEPPAHDDWSPDYLPKGHAQTFVRTGLKRIREAVSDFVYPAGSVTAGMADQPPLARAASMLGSMIPNAPADRTARAGRVQTGRRRPWTVSAPVFVSLEAADEAVDALFEVTASNRSRDPLTVEAQPGTVIEDEIGGGTTLPGGGTVSVVAWEMLDGTRTEGATHVVPAGQTSTARVRVRIPGLAAVGLILAVVD